MHVKILDNIRYYENTDTREPRHDSTMSNVKMYKLLYTITIYYLWNHYVYFSDLVKISGHDKLTNSAEIEWALVSIIIV